MNHSYQFNALLYWKYTIFVIILTPCFLMLFILFFFGLLSVWDYYVDMRSFRGDSITIFFSIFYGATSLFATFYFVMKLVHKYAMENWNISFDDQKIEISSNKRTKKIYALSQLSAVKIGRAVARLNQNATISLSFEEKENYISSRFTLETGISCLSKVESVNNYAIYQQFINDFEKEIISSQYDLFCTERLSFNNKSSINQYLRKVNKND